MTEAMQITVNSAIAKRMDDSNSTLARTACERIGGLTPKVLSDMGKNIR